MGAGNRSEVLGDRPDLVPRLERALLREAPQRIRHASFRRIDVDQLPGDGSVQHLRLGSCVAAKRCPLLASCAKRRSPPSADLLRAQIDEPDRAEHGRRLRQQPAQLLDRPWRRLMHRQGLPYSSASVVSAPRAKPRERLPRGCHASSSPGQRLGSEPPRGPGPSRYRVDE